ncbi:MAG: Bax inhibitor-1/YccA family protein [Alphaproteobacteria bacterium]|nr:Bax inhibitor-1/YccA family protein [Alphaproteobacteria bacterium]
MSYQPNVVTRTQADIDQGLRSHMLRVYNYMAAALGLTGLIAYFVGTNPAMMTTLIKNPVLFWVIALAPIALVFFLSFRIAHMSFATAQLTFWIFAALMGLSLASIFVVYTQESIARVFFITAGTFAAMSIYGYTTKRDLTNMGSFLMMGLIGIIIASVVNIFLKSSGLGFAISILGVLIFVGLTAYDTQKIKEMYMESDDSTISGKKAIMGALALYLDFINLFLMLLRLFGDRK